MDCWIINSDSKHIVHTYWKHWLNLEVGKEREESFRLLLWLGSRRVGRSVEDSQEFICPPDPREFVRGHK